MGQATLDLPDPLQSSNPAEAQSADDLLSQMAGDEIDRLLAESDGGGTEQAQSAGEAGPAAVEAHAEPGVDLDSVLEHAAADRTAEAERAALSAPAAVPAKKQIADPGPQIELGDSGKKLPIIFRPLEWLSSPLDPWPDQLREMMGKIGLMTLVNAIAVIGYVMYRRHHH